MKLFVTLTTLLIGCMLSAASLAHPHHGSEGASHLHFSIASMMLVAFVLLGYWLFARYLRGDKKSRNELDD